ncbi:MAG: FAD-dependent oxidoreductase [Saprospiraceae bacterium]
MIKTIEIKIFPDQLNDQKYLWKIAASTANVSFTEVDQVVITKRSIDARGKRPVYRMRCEVYIGELPQKNDKIVDGFRDVSKSKEVIIVGAGPAGYFAALRLIKEGLRPIIIDRGKDVQARRRDLKAIQQDGIVNPNSNYCFGEGGAGTYSDGKLYTRSHKRGKIVDVLRLLVEHDAPADILIDAHPHIGSNKLPKVVSNLRNTIEHFGGVVRFDCCLTDIEIEHDTVKTVTINDNETIKTDCVILATGHSARDIYFLLARKKVLIEAKPFALGLRIEHPQAMIDAIQYNQSVREENLPASSYSVVTQVEDCGVFSFCMCPGGLIVPAATAPGEIVVNGMSLSRRDSPFANSGLVTSISIEELDRQGYKGDFATLNFQKQVEQKMFAAGDGSQKAPAQRVSDFVQGKISIDVNESSYIPGLFSAPLHNLLPEFVSNRLRRGIKNISQKMRGYNTNTANVIGVESRTSSPVKIPRDRETLMHIDIKGLFPCGEGAGYAGGILSACMDGENVASAVKRWIEK